MNFREDQYYIKRVLKGNASAYALLVEKHKQMAFTLALRWAANREDAEEIAQDAFVKAFKALPSFKQQSNFTTWLYKIIYHTCMSRYRKKKIDSISMEKIAFSSSFEADSRNALDLLYHEDRKKVIRKAMTVLSTDEHSVMTLFYMGEKAIGEIADITGLTSSNIKILLFRGRKRLLIELKKILKDEIVDVL